MNPSDSNGPVKQKRGRKSKKELLAIQEQKELLAQQNQAIVFSLSEKPDLSENQEANNAEEDLKTSILENDTEENTVVKPPPKKRGRKPKGGKIVQQQVQQVDVKQEKPNVILSLKCTIKDIMHNNNCGFTILNQQNPVNGDLEAFNTQGDTFEVLDFNEQPKESSSSSTHIETLENPYGKENHITIIHKNFNNNMTTTAATTTTSGNGTTTYEEDYEYEYNNKTNEIREIWRKLKQLEHNLHTNNLSDKKSACFWCTCEFDNPPVYIPKHYIKDSYHVYGCFCSPECGTAYLMEENIDSSVKFERYHLMNHIYSKIYNYTKNIKPAPNPYYMLNKFYGNLSIQEYRSLLKNERLFLIVDKPLTRVLPELHEDNDDFILNNKVIPSNGYQIKKNTHKKPQTKSTILSEKFGLTAAM